MRAEHLPASCRAGLLLLLAGFLHCAPAIADDVFNLTPYLWAASLDGTLGAGATDPGGSATADFGKLWDNMSLAGAMLNASWRRDRWTVFGDWTYARVESDSPTGASRLYSHAEAEVRGNVMQVFAGWDSLPTGTGHLDLFAGLRYYDIDVDLELQGATLADRQAGGSAQWFDAVAGLRYLQRFGGRWQVLAQADVGAGGSEPSWEAVASLGYTFDWGTLVGGWRHLQSDYRDESLQFDAQLTGPFLGASFAF